MTPIQQQKAAKEFATHWEGKGYEKGESQIFWTTLLNQVFGIEHPETFIITPLSSTASSRPPK